MEDLDLWYDSDTAKISGVYCKGELEIGRIVQCEDNLNEATLMVLRLNLLITEESGKYRYFNCEVLYQRRK